MAQGGACGGGIESAQGDTGDGQLVGGLQGRGQDVGIEGFELLLGVVEPADQQQTVNRQVASVGGVHGIAVALQGLPRRVQRLGGGVQVAGGQRHLRLGHHAAGARHRFLCGEGPRRAPQQRPGAGQVAELRHGDAAQRQRRRVVAQRDMVQRPQRVAAGQGPRRR